MPILQPHISGEHAEDAWKLDSTRLLNDTERALQIERGRTNALLAAILAATDLDDLKARIQNI